MPGFAPECAHLLFLGVYGYFLHHNKKLHLDGAVPDESIWQRCWRRLAAPLASWYAMPSGTVGHRFTAYWLRNSKGFSAGVGTLRGPSSLPTSF